MVDLRCKRIIDGRTYNTETARKVAGWTWDEGPADGGKYLFQTRYGAFFEYSYQNGFAEDDFEQIRPFTPAEAQAWLEANAPYQADLIEELFGEMPEAGSGEVKFTLRMPESLRNRLSERAAANKQSLNAWMIRCLESCADAGDKP